MRRSVRGRLGTAHNTMHVFERFVKCSPPQSQKLSSGSKGFALDGLWRVQAARASTCARGYKHTVPRGTQMGAGAAPTPRRHALGYGQWCRTVSLALATNMKEEQVHLTKSAPSL